VSYHAVRAYYDIYEKTRREHPGLLFEICNDGGAWWISARRHMETTSRSPIHTIQSRTPRLLRHKPPAAAAMLESYVEKWPAPRLENFLYMLRSGMMAG